MNEEHPILLYDGFCSLCSSFVGVILKYERHPKLYFASLQSLYAKTILHEYGLDSKELNTVVLIEANKVYIKSRAVYKVATYLRFPFSLVKLFRFLPLFISDSVYDIIAKYRYVIFRKNDSCYVPNEFDRQRFLS